MIGSMIRNILAGLFASLAFFVSTQSLAQTQTIGSPGIATASYLFGSIQPFVGQRFVSPAGSTNLTQFTMAAFTYGPRTVMEPQIHVVTNGVANSSGLGAHDGCGLDWP